MKDSLMEFISSIPLGAKVSVSHKSGKRTFLAKKDGEIYKYKGGGKWEKMKAQTH